MVGLAEVRVVARWLLVIDGCRRSAGPSGCCQLDAGTRQSLAASIRVRTSVGPTITTPDAPLAPVASPSEEDPMSLSFPHRAAPEAVLAAAAHLNAQDATSFVNDLGDHLWWMATSTSTTGEQHHDITEEDWAQAAAYRTPLLAAKSLKALRKIRAMGKDFAPRQITDSDQDFSLRRDRFRREVDVQEQLVELVLIGLKAQEGIVLTPRNARRRAEHRLAQLNMSRDVPRGTISDLVDEERAAKTSKQRSPSALAPHPGSG